MLMVTALWKYPCDLTAEGRADGRRCGALGWDGVQIRSDRGRDGVALNGCG